MLIEFKDDLNKRNLLDRIDQRTIYEFYIKQALTEGRRYISPLREDNNPSITFKYYPATNSWLYMDWGNGLQDKPSSVFDFVSQLYRCDFYTSLVHINNDLGLGLQGPGKASSNVKRFPSAKRPEAPKEVLKLKKRLRVIFRSFEERDFEYWKQYRISRSTLRLFKVHPVKEFWIDGGIVKRDSPTTMVYCYIFGKRIKIYHPNSTSRFYGNVTSEDVSGYNLLPDKGERLVITKSHKDVMTLYEMGIPAIAPQSEGTRIAQKLIDEVSSRFDYVHLLYDNDQPGIDAAAVTCEAFPALFKIFIPLESGAKDLSDLVKNKGFEYASTIMDTLLW
jgi:hypothetical protein